LEFIRVNVAKNLIDSKLISNNSRWVVTGGAGFIGSHIVERLLSSGKRVLVIDNLITGARSNLEKMKEILIGEAAGKVDSLLNFVELSVAEYDQVADLIEKDDLILHQAALGSVPRSIDMPVETHQANVSGFLSILEAARKKRARRVVYASSSAVYGDSTILPKKEGEEGQPLSPYALTKSFNEQYARLWQRVYQLDLVGLRYFNVFGPRQNPNGGYAAVIPRWIKSAIKGEAAIINGSLEISRDFCYVENVVNANLLAALREEKFNGEAFNIACASRTTLAELHHMIAKEVEEQFGIRCPTAALAEYRKGDVMNSSASIERATKEIAYQPAVFIEEGIKRTVRSFNVMGDKCEEKI
jgi:UDP-N-acetylglucosamine 4-epimerase